MEIDTTSSVKYTTALFKSKKKKDLPVFYTQQPRNKRLYPRRFYLMELERKTPGYLYGVKKILLF